MMLKSYIYWRIGSICQKMNLHKMSIRLMEKVLHEGDCEEASILASIAYSYVLMGQYLEAIGYARKIQLYNSSHSRVFSIIRYIKSAVANAAWCNTTENAYEVIKAATETWPQDSFILIYRAYYEYVIKGNHSEGEVYLKMAFQLNNTNEDLLYNLKGRIFIQGLGRNEEGVRFLEKAVEIDPSIPNLVALGYELREIDLQKAKRVLESLYTKESKNKDVAYCYAEILIREKEYEKAYDIIKKTLKLFHKDADLLVLQGYGYFQKEEYDKSIKSLKKGLKRNHSHPVYVLKTLAEAYLAKELPLQAEKYIKQALRIDPENTEAQTLLGRLK